MARHKGKNLKNEYINILKAIIFDTGIMKGKNSTYFNLPVFIKLKDGNATTIKYHTKFVEVMRLWDKDSESNEKFIDSLEKTFTWIKYKIQSGINLANTPKD